MSDSTTKHACDICGHVEASADKLDRHRKCFHVPVTTVIPAPTPSVDQDVTAAIRLLEYLRAKGYRVGPVKLGSLQLTIEDLRIDDHEGLKPHEHQARSIWADAGLTDGPPGDGTVGS